MARLGLRAGLSLLTIRHYNTDVFEKLTAGKTIVLTQRTQETIQTLCRIT